jgi:hypothetical protein
VDVIRQDADRNRFERMLLLHGLVYPPKAIDMVHQEIARAIPQSNCEEEHAAFDLCSPIPGHGATL